MSAPPSSPAHLWRVFDICFPSKVAAAVGASALKLEHKAGERRARDIGNEWQRGERARGAVLFSFV